MQEYHITIFGQKRTLLGLFLTPIIFLLSIFIGAKLNSFILPIFFLMISFLTIYYFMVGNLTIRINDDNELFFEWKKKFVFNYKPIQTIKINDIKTIILDEERLLRKIKTDQNTVHINNARIMTKDADLLITKLKNDAEKYNIKIMDSWDEMSEKGYLKIAYTVNSYLLAVSIIAAVFYTVLKGFNSVSLSILLLLIPQMILYRKQMKNKTD